MSKKKWTPEEIRQTVCDLEWNYKHGVKTIKIASQKVIEQLRQGAEAEEARRGWKTLESERAKHLNTVIRELQKRVITKCRTCKCALGGEARTFRRKKMVHPNAKCFWCKKRIGKKREGYTLCGYITCWSCALDMLLSSMRRGYDGENYRDT